MKSFRDLNIYSQAHYLAIGIHNISLTLPKYELYKEGSQIRRSSKAVSTAIVEGYSRKRYKADFIKFLVYAQANEFKEQYTALGKQINRFIGWVDKNWNVFPENPSQ